MTNVQGNDDVAVSMEGYVATVEMRRPPNNFLDIELIANLASVLEALDDELEAEGIQLMFAELKDVVRRDIKSYRTDWLTHDDRFFPTVGAAARAYAELYPDAAREAGVDL